MIHKYKLFDTNIVADVNSGAVHVFDDAAYEVLEHYKTHDASAIADKLGGKYTMAEIEEAIEEIASLEKAGQLYSEDIFESRLPLWEKKTDIKAMCLHVSHDCNMRCGYCFASTGDFGQGRALMSVETAKKAIDFLIAHSGKRRNLEIDFFGGEPLMNFEPVKETVFYAKSRERECGKNFRFTVTTNALLLNDEHKAFFNQYMDNVVMSIDGRKAVNDSIRTRVDGTGTYDRILPRIKDMAESRDQNNYYVRGTFTRKNLDFSEDVLHLADEGFRQVSVEPVVAAKGTGYDIREEDLPVLKDEYEKLAWAYVERIKEGNAFNFFHFMIDLNQGPCIAKRLTGCGAGHEYAAVTPDGDIYPCHQFVGMDGFKMGNVHHEGLDKEIQDTFKNSSVYTKDECMQCWARFYCSGGCAANAYQFNGDINKPYAIGCELERKRVECALWIKAQGKGS